MSFRPRLFGILSSATILAPLLTFRPAAARGTRGRRAPS